MFVDFPQESILIVVGAFLLGWILSSISSRLGSRLRAKKRDTRDDRIRELEAGLRIAKSEAENSESKVADLNEQAKEAAISLERRDDVISEQQAKIELVSTNLKESVLKTRELRAELTERATENVHAEAKIREVETELSVAQASTDMIATGVLDYSISSDADVPEDDANTARPAARSNKVAG